MLLLCMPTAVGGFKYIVDIRDDLKGFCDAKVLRNNKSSTILKFLKDFMIRYGYLKRIVSDRGEMRGRDAFYESAAYVRKQ